MLPPGTNSYWLPKTVNAKLLRRRSRQHIKKTSSRNRRLRMLAVISKRKAPYFKARLAVMSAKLENLKEWRPSF